MRLENLERQGLVIEMIYDWLKANSYTPVECVEECAKILNFKHRHFIDSDSARVLNVPTEDIALTACCRVNEILRTLSDWHHIPMPILLNQINPRMRVDRLINPVTKFAGPNEKG